MRNQLWMGVVALLALTGCGDDAAMEDGDGVPPIDGDAGGPPMDVDAGDDPPVGGGMDTVVYSDQGGLYRIDDGEPVELGVGPDYRVLTRLRLSPNGENLVHTVGRDLRVTSVEDGGFVLENQAGHVPWTWLDDETVLAGAPGAGLGSIAWVVTVDLEGTVTVVLDPDGREYCTGGPHPLSPDGGRAVFRCGFGNDGELVVGDFATGTMSDHGPTKITSSGTPPIWLDNGWIAHPGEGGDLAIVSSTLDDARTIDVPAATILRAGPNAVLSVGVTVGDGGINIQSFALVEVPSGEVTDLAWLAEVNPPFQKVVFDAAGERVAFAEGNGIFVANVDGSERTELKPITTGRLAPALQSLTW